MAKGNRKTKRRKKHHGAKACHKNNKVVFKGKRFVRIYGKCRKIKHIIRKKLYDAKAHYKSDRVASCLPTNVEPIPKTKMNILVDTVRIANFRGIQNLEVKLSPITVLVGANNAGKTSFLKALHLALGMGRKSVTRDDVYDDGTGNSDDLDIIIDVRITPINEDGEHIKEFNDLWSETNGFSGNIQPNEDDKDQLIFRTRYSFDTYKQEYISKANILKQWSDFDSWQEDTHVGSPYKRPDSLPLIFMDAQRDVLADLKDRHSYLGKLTEHPEIDKDVLEKIESDLATLNTTIVEKSPTLNQLKENLEELNSTVNAQGDGVEIIPVSKTIRDIGRNLSINFKDTHAQSFPLDNHGMGTRSWASLLTLKAYIAWMKNNLEGEAYWPLLALEEPEAHLHPNAQRQLFRQLKGIYGQKIISTHSPFVSAQAHLTELRHFYKTAEGLHIGELELSIKNEHEIAQLKERIQEEGGNPEIKKELCPQIKQLLIQKRDKLNKEDKRKIEREVMHSKGELLFSKAIILAEGETEEQAIPLLMKEYLNCHSFELGITFVGVGGKDKYKPLLSVAKRFNIPWYILSDGDNNTESEVKGQVRKVFGKDFMTTIDQHLFVLDDTDFEGYLVKHGYSDEIITAIDEVKEQTDYLSAYIEEQQGQKRKGEELKDYTIESGKEIALLDCMREHKTEFAPYIAEHIINKRKADGSCQLPPAIENLFNQIKSDLNL